MKLAELKKAKSAAPAVREASAVGSAPDNKEGVQREPQGVTSVTPSGISIYYQWAPKRLYQIAEPASHADGVEVPSVTTVLGVLDKSGPLTYWAMKVGIAGCVELANRGVLTLSGPNENPRLEAQILEKLVEHKLTVNHVKDKAADRGVNVHGALETLCAGEPISDPEKWPENERGYIEGLAAFFKAIAAATDANAFLTELMVGSLQHQYAGRFDLVLTLSKPVDVVVKCYPKKPPKIEEIPAGRYLLDLKTSKRVYSTHFLQLEAYEAAAVECGYAATDYRGVVHVTEDGRYELALNKDWSFEDFLAVRQCYQVMNERKIVQALRDELGAVDA